MVEIKRVKKEKTLLGFRKSIDMATDLNKKLLEQNLDKESKNTKKMKKTLGVSSSDSSNSLEIE